MIQPQQIKITNFRIIIHSKLYYLQHHTILQDPRGLYLQSKTDGLFMRSNSNFVIQVCMGYLIWNISRKMVIFTFLFVGAKMLRHRSCKENKRKNIIYSEIQAIKILSTKVLLDITISLITYINMNLFL